MKKRRNRRGEPFPSPACNWPVYPASSVLIFQHRLNHVIGLDSEMHTFSVLPVSIAKP